MLWLHNVLSPFLSVTLNFTHVYLYKFKTVMNKENKTDLRSAVLTALFLTSQVFCDRCCVTGCMVLLQLHDT